MLRIGFNYVVAGERNTGAKEYLTNLITELVRLGGPERYTIYFRSDESAETIERFRRLGEDVNCVRTPIPMFPTPVRVAWGELYWRSQVRRDRLHVFHHTYFPVPRGVERECAVVLTLHDLIQRGMPEAFRTGRRLFTNFVQPGAFRKASRIVVVSNHVVDDMARFHPEIPRGKIHVVPCAVDPVYLEVAGRELDARAESIVRERYGLPDRYILGVGHLEPRKNWGRLIEAYARVRDRVGGAAPNLVIVGVENFNLDGIYGARGIDRVRDHVSFTGYVEPEHLPAIYRLAMLFAYPSLYEGFGIPVLEAMAAGVPVLTSNVTSLPEVAGDAACLVDPYSVDSIEDGLVRLLSDEAYRSTLIKRGHRNVERYSWRESARELRQVYRSAAAENRNESAAGA